jgi:sorbitol-specific phosphotransferase system component IIC
LCHISNKLGSSTHSRTTTMTCMSTCISPELFDYSSDRTSVSQLSSLLGYKFIDAYIGLTANQKVSQYLYVPCISWFPVFFF